MHFNDCAITLSCNKGWTQKFRKQPSRVVLRKKCSENMQQIYRRTPKLKCDFNKIAEQLLLKSHFGMGVLLQICCIFPEHLFLRTALDGCFWNLKKRGGVCVCWFGIYMKCIIFVKHGIDIYWKNMIHPC